jgi:hypothetical protein
MTAAYRKGRLMRALLQLLASSPDGVPAKDAILDVKDKVALAPEEEGVFDPSGAEIPQVAAVCHDPGGSRGLDAEARWNLDRDLRGPQRTYQVR